MAIDDLHRAKRGAVTLTVCLVQTLEEALKDADPEFKERFLKKLTSAYYELRDNSEDDPQHELEMLGWTREMLTGFSMFSGQGKPFLED